MPMQYEMKKCKKCQEFFWVRYLKGEQCPKCLSIPIAKQEMTEQAPKEEKPNTNSEGKQ